MNCDKLFAHFFTVKKRQSKTPAQDRLQNVATQLRNAAPAQNQLRNVATQLFTSATPAQNRLRNVDTQPKNVKPFRLQNLATKNKNLSEKIKRSEKSTADFNKSKSGHVRNTSLSASAVVVVKQHTLHKSQVDSSDEIPRLFPPKTPGQDRLNHFRNSLNPHNKNKPSNNESTQHVLNVIKSEFGLSSGLSDKETATIEEDEPMEWESCDIFERVENIVYNDFINPYIIPDTNVFLDDLSCIRDTVNRGSSKYNVLVPFAVLQELDRLKGRLSDSRISSLASGAIRFIYNQLKSKRQRLQGE